MADRKLLLPIMVAAVGLAGIFVGENLPTRHSVEAKLTDRSIAALRQAGITDAAVSFTGRDGTVSVLSVSDADRARAIVAGQEGVRVATVRVVRALPIGQPAVTVSSRPVATDGATPGAPPSPTPPSPTPPSPTPTAPSPGPMPSSSPAPTAAGIEAQLKAAGSIQFTLGSAELTAGSHPTIAKIAAILTAHPDVHVRIEGNTDSTGSAAGNLALSKDRADAVYAALVKLGIDASRLTTVGYGETHPLVPNTTDANRAINRRVDFVVR